MNKVFVSMTLGAIMVAAPAKARHAFETTAHPTRGECEAQRAALSNDDRWLLDAYPELFSSTGEVRSFLNKAFTCERGLDGQWYIIDHRDEVLNSAWFQRRL
jgi:hypothetical protein